MSEWHSGKLGDFIQLQRGYDLPEYEREPGEVPVVTSSGISGKHSIAKVKGPGVVMGRYGTIGEIYYVREDFWPHNTTLYVKNFGGNDPHFIAYFLQTMHYQAHSDKSSVPGLNRNDLYTIPVTLPPLPEQREIAHILAAFDDKIDLNRRMNAALEATARALFQSWFVDFDPVRAKAEGRAPEGMDATTAALFPDSFEDSALGLIPSGWRVEPLDGIADFQNGLALQKFPPESDEFLPVIKIRELRQGYVDESSDKASSNIRESCIVYDGDVLFSWSGSLMVDLWCGGMGALNQHLFKVTSTEYPKWFYLQWTQHHLDNFVRVAADKATTMGHIQRHHLSSANTIVPPEDVLLRLDQIMTTLVDKMIETRLESRKLAETRDTLLPLLMAGKLL
jgi:type I restriction enzyme, S subunit